MSKTITVSDETYKLIKEQVENDKKETKLEIKNRFTGEVIFTSRKTTYKEAVEEAIEKKVSLQFANLRGADLKGANLKYANLEDADLKYANLECASLQGANLKGANLKYVDLYHAKLYGRGGGTRINKSQINAFLEALGVIAE